MHRAARAGLLLIVAIVFAVAAHGAAAQQPYVGMLDEHPAIEYALRPTRDRVSLLNRAINEGAVTLSAQEKNGYLHSVLGALGVPVESQLLVFSKTGVQGAATSPRNPRAIFFDSAVAVGYIPGARFLEIASHDPEQGVVFYTVDQTSTGKPAFTRRQDCLRCHISANTLDVPGMINRSMFTAADGRPLPMLGSHLVDHRTRLLDRWGGMYVTGNYTQFPYNVAVHMGNVATTVNDEGSGPTASNEVFIQWMNSAPETRGYPSAESDIASMMVFDHQMHAMNLLTRLNWDTRVAASRGGADFAGGALAARVDELADYLLFVGEPPPPARITPRAGFAERFAARAPTDRLGRSLYQLDLERRLMRYPCSYMVYSNAFAGLPVSAKDTVYQRLWVILSGRDSALRYAHLSEADRRAIVDILRETKQDLPASFK